MDSGNYEILSREYVKLKRNIETNEMKNPKFRKIRYADGTERIIMVGGQNK